MFPDLALARSLSCLTLTSAVVEALRNTANRDELVRLMESVAREMRFRYYALIHHDDLRTPRPDLVDLKDYPSAIAERLFGQHRYRRDPVIRGCLFADGAFLWSDLSRFIHLDRHDRASFAMGAAEGLNEGITVPYVRLSSTANMKWISSTMPTPSI
ncbi:MAG: LuxR family transcriptional regulator [Bradyrhizobium sp.]|nr:LuxR family transcriptional regulator [Bradyrhizobium sp.]